MRKCELDVMEYAVTMENEMLDDEILLDETICELDDDSSVEAVTL